MSARSSYQTRSALTFSHPWSAPPRVCDGRYWNLMLLLGIVVEAKG